MSTWEERMSQRAKARMAIEEEARRAEHAERVARLEDNPMPGESLWVHEGPHFGHYEHWCGNGRMCSCGVLLGIATVVIPDDYEPKACEICKTRKIGGFALEGRRYG